MVDHLQNLRHLRLVSYSVLSIVINSQRVGSRDQEIARAAAEGREIQS